MKRVVILGNSIAGVNAAEEIRSTNKDVEIMILSFDGYYPYVRCLFADLASGEIPASRIFYRSEDFYKKNKIDIVLDKNVTRINFKRNRIFTEDRGQIEYDALIISDVPSERLPAIKGINKSGVFSVKRFDSFNRAMKQVPFVDEIIVQADCPEGLNIASALDLKGKDVALILPDKGDFVSVNGQELADELYIDSSMPRDNKLRLVTGTSISEILGDSDVMAVRLKTGKVMACQMILFDMPCEDLRIFNDTGLQINNEKICVDSGRRTNFKNVFVIGNLCGFVDNCDAEQNGECFYFLLHEIFDCQDKIARTAVKSG